MPFLEDASSKSQGRENRWVVAGEASSSEAVESTKQTVFAKRFTMHARAWNEGTLLEPYGSTKQ